MGTSQAIHHLAEPSRRALRTIGRLKVSPIQKNPSQELAGFLSLPLPPSKSRKIKQRRRALPKTTVAAVSEPTITDRAGTHLLKGSQSSLHNIIHAINQPTQPLPHLSDFSLILQTDPPPAGDSSVPHDYLLPWILIFHRLHIRSIRTNSSDCFWLSIKIYRLLQLENIVDIHRQMIIRILKSALTIEESKIDQKVWNAVNELTQNVGKVQEPTYKSSEINKNQSALVKFQGHIRTPLPQRPTRSLSTCPAQIVRILVLLLRLLARSPPLPDLPYMHHIRSIFDRLNRQPQASILLEESSLTHLPNSLMMNAPSVFDALEIAWWFNRLSPLRPRPITSLVVSANIILDRLKKTTPIGPPGPLLSFWGEAGTPSLVTSAKAKEAIQTLLNAYVQEMIDLVSRSGACPADHRERTLGYVRQLGQFAINVDQSVAKADARDEDRRQDPPNDSEKKDKMEDGTWAGLMINALSWCGDYTGALEVYHRVFILGRESRDDLALSVTLDACGYSGAPERATKIWISQLDARQPLSDNQTQSYLECLLRTGSLKTTVIHLGSIVPPSISSKPRWPGHIALPFAQEDKVLGMMSKSLLVGRSIVDGKTKSTKFEIDETALNEFEQKLMELLNEEGKTRLRAVLRGATNAWKDNWTGDEEEKEEKAENVKKGRQKHY